MKTPCALASAGHMAHNLGGGTPLPDREGLYEPAAEETSHKGFAFSYRNSSHSGSLAKTQR